MIVLYEKYLEILSGYLSKYFEQQKPYIFCKEGCSICCERGDYPFSKLEFDYLMLGYEALDEIQKSRVDENIKRVKQELEQCVQEKFEHICPFLLDNKCSVYEQRGIICRSYGLMHFIEDDEGNLKYKSPCCVDMGLNYSNVIDPETNMVSGDLWEKTGFKEEPNSYNVGLKFLLNNEITKKLEIDFGELKRLIDWL